MSETPTPEVTARPALLSPAAIRERTDRQRRAARRLAELLELAEREGLPPLAWQLDEAGDGLVGQSVTADTAWRRADFDAWCQALGAERRTEVTVGPTTYLRAAMGAAHDEVGLVSVVLVAALYATPTERPGGPHRPAPAVPPS